MKSYRDYLNEKKVPRGPWIVYENCEKKPETSELNQALQNAKEFSLDKIATRFDKKSPKLEVVKPLAKSA